VRPATRILAAVLALVMEMSSSLTAQPPIPRRAERFFDRASAPRPPLIPGEPITTVSGPPPRHDKVAERVLVIRDPAVLEDSRFGFDPSNGSQAAIGSPANSWGFPAVVRRVRKLAGDTASDAIALNWLRVQLPADVAPDSRAADPLASGEWRSPTLDGAPFRLLAIVNRPDLAKFKPCAACPEDGLARGAEVRFEYGATTKAAGKPVEFAIIVEFVLKSLSKAEFKNYVGQWMTLGADTVTDRPLALQTLIDDVLNTKASFARFRVIGLDRMSSKWPMREYSNEIGTITMRPLFRQLPMRETCTPGISSPQLARWLNVPNHACAVLAQDYDFSAISPPVFCSGETATAQVTSGMPTARAAAAGMPTDFKLGTNVTEVCSNRSRLQLILGLNSCTRCHHRETGAQFLHIGNRLRGARSNLSGFLCGGVACGAAVMTTYFTAPMSTRKFNDLIRRHEYMLAIAGLDPAGSNWTTSLAGLINYEVH
jgi:hypothetical protein